MYINWKMALEKWYWQQKKKNAITVAFISKKNSADWKWKVISWKLWNLASSKNKFLYLTEMLLGCVLYEV